MALQNLGQPAGTSALSMGSILARVRFSELWLVVGCALDGSFVVCFAEPGRLEEGVAGVMEDEPVTTGMAYVYAAMVGLPLALAVAALFLPGRASAMVNLVVAVPLGAFGLFAIVTELAEGPLHPHVTLAALAAASAWLIAGLSIAELRRLPHGDAMAAAVAAEARGAE